MDYPSRLGKNPVQILALDVYVLSHHTLPRFSFHLKTRQEYLFYDQESFDMLKTGLGRTWFPPSLAPPVLILSRKWARMRYLANYCSDSPHFCCNNIFY
jgi:hypothetical protein